MGEKRKLDQNIVYGILAIVLAGIVLGGMWLFKLGPFGQKLSGTYYEVNGTGSVTFVDDKNMELNTLGIINMKGTYDLSSDEKKLTFHYSIPLLGTQDVSYDFSKDGDSIFIGKTEYKKK
jgi:hypothetical protein